VDRRFSSPLGALLHARQASIVRDLVRRQGIRRAAELAPGPARVTIDVAPLLDRVLLLDASRQMLAEARRRLGTGAGAARFVQADAFRLPLRTRVDLVYTFRLIRHFERQDRLRLYREVAGILSPGGWLIFDAVNEVVSAPLRARAAHGEYEHFDALLTPNLLRDELQEAGFRLDRLLGAQRRYSLLVACQIYVAPRSAALARAAMELVDRFGGEPLEWVVICRRE
jgi:ubiquinone/menaquinone biosynthesis C-methylase UbiE